MVNSLNHIRRPSPPTDLAIPLNENRRPSPPIDLASLLNLTRRPSPPGDVRSSLNPIRRPTNPSEMRGSLNPIRRPTNPSEMRSSVDVTSQPSSDLSNSLGSISPQGSLTYAESVKKWLSSDSDDSSGFSSNYESDEDVFTRSRSSIEVLYVADRDRRKETKEQKEARLEKIKYCREIISLVSSKVPKSSSSINKDPMAVGHELGVWMKAAMWRSEDDTYEDVYTPLFDIYNVNSELKTKLRQEESQKRQETLDRLADEAVLKMFAQMNRTPAQELNQKAASGPKPVFEDDWEELKYEIEATVCE